MQELPPKLLILTGTAASFRNRMSRFATAYSIQIAV
jgi:hypothetical protein